MTTQLYQIPLRKVQDVRFEAAAAAAAPSPPATSSSSSAARSTAAAAPAANAGVTYVRVELAAPLLLDSVQLRGSVLSQASSAGMHVLAVRAKLHADEEFHDLPGAGYDQIPRLGGGSSLESPRASNSMLARQKFKVLGLARFVELKLQGNVRQACSAPQQGGNEKEEPSLLRSMVGSSPFGLNSPSASETLSRTSSSGNRFTLPRLNVPRHDLSDSFNGGSSVGSESGASDEPLLLLLSGYRLDSTPVASHVIPLLNMATNIQLAADAWLDKHSAAASSSSSSASHPYLWDLVELHQLTGLALSNQRSLVSATEMFRKSMASLHTLLNQAIAEREALVAAAADGSAAERLATLNGRLRLVLERISALHLLLADALGDGSGSMGVSGAGKEQNACYNKLQEFQAAAQALKAAYGDDLANARTSKAAVLAAPPTVSLFSPLSSIPPPAKQLSPSADLRSSLRSVQHDLLETLLFHLDVEGVLAKKNVTHVAGSASQSSSSAASVSVSPPAAAASPSSSAAPSSSASSPSSPSSAGVLVPAVHLTLFRSLSFLLDHVGPSLSGRQVHRLLSVLMSNVPITPLPSKPAAALQLPNSTLATSTGKSNRPSSASAFGRSRGSKKRNDDSDSDSSSSSSDSSSDDDDDSAESSEDEEAERVAADRVRATAASGIVAASPVSEFTAVFPMLTSSVEKARRSHGATQISDAFFRALRSLLDLLPDYLNCAAAVSQSVFFSAEDGSQEENAQVAAELALLFARQVCKYFPPDSAAADGNASESPAAWAPMQSQSSSGGGGGGHVNFGDFIQTLGLSGNALATSATALNSGPSAAVSIAWTTLKNMLLQGLVLCTYTLQGDLMASLATKGGSDNFVPEPSDPFRWSALFGSLLTALRDEEEEIRKTAAVAWCMLRDVYPLALVSALSAEDAAAEESESPDSAISSASASSLGAQSGAIANLRSFVELVVSTLSQHPPFDAPMLSKSVSSGSSSSSSQMRSPTAVRKTASGHGASASSTSEEVLPTDISPFASNVTASSPPPSSASPLSSTGSASTSWSGSAVGELPRVDLAMLMLDLVYKIATEASRVVQQHQQAEAAVRALGASSSVDLDASPSLLLQSLSACDAFAQLVNFVCSLLERECSLVSVRSMLLMLDYFVLLKLLIPLTSATPIQPVPIIASTPVALPLPESLAVEHNGASLTSLSNATGSASSNANRPQLVLPMLPLSSAASFRPRLRELGALGDATAFHAFLLPLVDLTASHCAHSCPKVELLQLLCAALSNVGARDLSVDKQLTNALVRLLHSFLAWVPHSVHDESFDLLNLLLSLLSTADAVTPALLQALLAAFTDKYTVRSQAYRFARDLFVQVAVLQLLQESTQPIGAAKAGDVAADRFFMAHALLSSCLLARHAVPPSLPPADAALDALAGVVASHAPDGSTPVKGRRGADGAGAQALESWGAKLFEERKDEELQREHLALGIQLMATLLHFAHHAGSPPSAEETQALALLSGHSQAFASAKAAPVGPLSPAALQTFVAQYAEPLLSSTRALLSSVQSSQRLNGVVIAGLVTSLLLVSTRRGNSSDVVVLDAKAPLLQALLGVSREAVARGHQEGDHELVHAGVLHGWRIVHELSVLHVTTGSAGVIDAAALRARLEVACSVWMDTASAAQLLSSSSASSSSFPSSPEVRHFSLWALLQLAEEIMLLAEAASALPASDEAAALQRDIAQSIEKHVVAAAIGLTSSSQASSRTLGVQLLAIVARLLSSSSAPLSFGAGSIPPALRSSATPFVEVSPPLASLGSTSRLEQSNGGGGSASAEAPIDTLSSVADFGALAADLDFFVYHSAAAASQAAAPAGLTSAASSQPSVQHAPRLLASQSESADWNAGSDDAMHRFSAPALSRAVMQLHPHWFARTTPAAPSAVLRIKAALLHLQRDWHGLVARSARLLFDFFTFSARAQASQPSSDAAASSVVNGDSGTCFHASMLVSEWRAWSLSVLQPAASRVVTCTTPSALPAPPSLLFRFEQEHARVAASGCGTFASILHSLLPAAAGSDRSSGAGLAASASSFKFDGAGSEGLLDHITRLFSHALEGSEGKAGRDGVGSDGVTRRSGGRSSVDDADAEFGDLSAMASGSEDASWTISGADAAQQLYPAEDGDEDHHAKEDEDEKGRDFGRAQKITASVDESKEAGGKKKKGSGKKAAGKSKQAGKSDAQLAREEAAAAVLTSLVCASPHAAWKGVVARNFSRGLLAGFLASSPPWSAREMDALFFRALKRHIASIDQHREEQARKAREAMETTNGTRNNQSGLPTLAGSRSPSGPLKSSSSSSSLKLGGASSMGSSIAEELDRMVRALENSERDDEDDDEEEDDEDRYDEDDDAEIEHDEYDRDDAADAFGGLKAAPKGVRANSDDDNGEQPRWATSSGLGATLTTPGGIVHHSATDAIDDDAAAHDGTATRSRAKGSKGATAASSSSAAGMTSRVAASHAAEHDDDDEELSDEDVEDAFAEYEDDALIDDAELDAAAAVARGRSGSARGRGGQVPMVSSDFREAIKQTAREHIDALKTTSARPRKQQSAVSSSASSAAAAPEASSSSSGGSGGMPKSFLLTRSKACSGWEGADPDDMGQATSRTERPRPSSASASTSAAAAPSSRLKRPESAGRRRRDVLSPSADPDMSMDQIDKIILAQTQKRDERKKTEAATAAGNTKSSTASKPSSASSIPTAAPASASSKSVVIPRLAFGGALPISSAMLVSRPVSSTSAASSASNSSARSSRAAASLMPTPAPVPIPQAVPMPLDQQVMIEEYYEEDDTPLGDYAKDDDDAEEDVVRTQHGDEEEEEARSGVASDSAIHKQSALSPARSEEGERDDDDGDASHFDVQLANSQEVSLPGLSGAAIAVASSSKRNPDEDEVEEELEQGSTPNNEGSEEEENRQQERHGESRTAEATTPTRFRVQAASSSDTEEPLQSTAVPVSSLPGGADPSNSPPVRRRRGGPSPPVSDGEEAADSSEGSADDSGDDDEDVDSEEEALKAELAELEDDEAEEIEHMESVQAAAAAAATAGASKPAFKLSFGSANPAQLP